MEVSIFAALKLEPYEQTNIFELVKTDNKLFNKLLLVFASLCVEAERLETLAREKFYPPLILFGELFGMPSEGDAQLQIGTHALN